MSVEVAPTTPADVAEFLPDGLPWRIRAWTARRDSNVIGIGGIAYLPDGTMIAFLEASEEDCQKHRVTLHRMALRFFSQFKAQGARRIVAIVDAKREAAARWLKRIGFEPVGEVDGEVVYRWQA